MIRPQITPGSRVLIMVGAHKGQERTVMHWRKHRLVLKDLLGDTMSKKVYNLSIHHSNCKLIHRNYKPPRVEGK